MFVYITCSRRSCRGSKWILKYAHGVVGGGGERTDGFCTSRGDDLNDVFSRNVFARNNVFDCSLQYRTDVKQMYKNTAHIISVVKKKNGIRKAIGVVLNFRNEPSSRITNLELVHYFRRYEKTRFHFSRIANYYSAREAYSALKHGVFI